MLPICGPLTDSVSDTNPTIAIATSGGTTTPTEPRLLVATATFPMAEVPTGQERSSFERGFKAAVAAELPGVEARDVQVRRKIKLARADVASTCRGSAVQRIQ